MSHLYSGELTTTAAALITASAGNVTTITYAKAHNKTANAVSIDLSRATSIVFDIATGVTIEPYGTIDLFAILGTKLTPSQTIRAKASADASVNVIIDGYEQAIPA